MQSSTSSHGAIHENSMTHRSLPTVQPMLDIEQRWKFHVSDIPAFVTSRLTSYGVLYILLGLLSVGLEVVLWENGLFCYGVGVLNGAALLYVGLMSIILSRQQIYSLTTLFAIVFGQMFCSIGTLTVYALIFFMSSYGPLHCHRSSIFDDDDCKFGTIQIILVADLMHTFSTFCIVVSNLNAIYVARRPVIPVVPTPCIVYNPQSAHMPVSFQNPMATTVTVNHS